MIKKVLLITACLLLSVLSFAKSDSLAVHAKLDSLTSSVLAIQSQNATLRQKNEDLLRRVTILERSLATLQGQSETIEGRVSNTEKGLVDNTNSIQSTKEGLASQIQATDDKVSGQETSLKHKTLWGIIIAFIVLAISALLSFLLSKKGNAKIEALQGKAEKLNEEIVNKMSTEVGEIQKVTASLSSLSAAGASSQNEQDLIKALADRITFMEMTLYKMDPSIKGYKHLTKSIAQMKDNLRANGYELIDMLGKEYSEGMKATVSFDDDDTLAEGTRIITKVIKPQINYNGVMIQSAQITVSQNI